MSFMPLMNTQTCQALGKILNSHIPDWNGLARQAQEAIDSRQPLFKVPFEQIDAFRKPLKGMNHDLWQIDDGICLQRHPTLLEKLAALLTGILGIFLAPLRALQKKIEEFIFSLASRLGQIGGILALPLTILLMIIDFFRDYLFTVLKSITNPIAFILAILRFPIWFLKSLISRLMEALLAPLLAKVLTQIEKAQQALIAFLAKYGWLRGILLGMIRDGGRPLEPVIIPKRSVSDISTVRRRGRDYLLIVEGDRLLPGFGELFAYKMKQIIFPYYWERTVHMILLPKNEAETVKSAITAALSYDRAAEESIDKLEDVSTMPLMVGTEMQTDQPVSVNTCPQCHTTYDLSKKFCGKCGVSLATSSATPGPQAPESQVVPIPTSSESSVSAPTNGTSRVLVWVMVTVVIAVVGYFAYDSFIAKKNTQGNSNSSQQVTINKDVVLRSGPGIMTQALGKLTPTTRVVVTGSATDPKGNAWNSIRIESGPLQGKIGYVKPSYLNGAAPVSTALVVTPAPTPRQMQESFSQNSSSEFSRENIKAMLDSFITMGNAKDYGILELYADQVSTFNNNVVDKAALRKDEEHYFNRWHSIRFTLMDDFTVTDVADNPNRRRVEFRFNFQLERPQKSVSGISQTTWILENQGGRLKIVDQKEQILSRKTPEVADNQPVTSAPPSGSSDVETTVRNYYRAVQDKRVDDAINMYAAEKRATIKTNLIRGVAKDTEYYAIDSIAVSNSDDLHADALVRLRHKKYRKPEEPWEIKVSLVKEDGVWKVYGTPGRKL